MLRLPILCLLGEALLIGLPTAIAEMKRLMIEARL
jgi:pyridoxine 5'-phosphate synthase PdxJ